MNARPPSLNNLLQEVSRSFYLTLRVLPGAVRAPIGLAYLLARATDTIADTELVPVAQRLAALRALRERILGRSRLPLDFSELARHQGAGAGPPGSPSERTLLERIEEILGALEECSPPDQKLLRDVLDTITSGQELDLERFDGATVARIVALAGEAELADYTYRVAGCVGEFWTRICRAHLFPRAPLDEAALLADGIRFGQGLQLVNILRDLPADLRAGRCYVPAAALQAHGLCPADLLDPANARRFRPLYLALLAQADAHLAAGWAYTNALPRGCVRVRLACAWPILIGVKTLARLRVENVLEASRRVKVTRAEVRQLMLRSVLAYPRPRAWQRLFAQAGGGSVERRTD